LVTHRILTLTGPDEYIYGIPSLALLYAALYLTAGGLLRLFRLPRYTQLIVAFLILFIIGSIGVFLDRPIRANVSGIFTLRFFTKSLRLAIDQWLLSLSFGIPLMGRFYVRHVNDAGMLTRTKIGEWFFRNGGGDPSMTDISEVREL